MSLAIRELIAIGAKQLADAGVADSDIDARELYCYLMGWTRTGLMMRWQETADDNQCEKYFELVERRASRVPLQHITGVQEFMGLEFKVNEHVLIPRQDTETMVEDALELLEKGTLRSEAYAAAKDLKGADVLDLCCGSGAIGLSLAKLARGLSVTCSDISTEALAVARDNGAALGASHVRFLESDMFAAPALNGKLGRKKFNLIISNPPYIEKDVIAGLEPEVKDHEPMAALDGGDDGMDFYRIIAEQAPLYLKKRGVLMMEIGWNQGETVTGLLAEDGRFDKIRCLPDLTGKDRIVVATLAETKRK